MTLLHLVSHGGAKPVYYFYGKLCVCSNEYCFPQLNYHVGGQRLENTNSFASSQSLMAIQIFFCEKRYTFQEPPIVQMHYIPGADPTETA